ncbi:hypothetical protein D3C76_1472480 [compost metagenome]
MVGQRVKLLLALQQELAQRLQARGALLEVHCHQCSDTLFAGIGNGFGEVEGFLVGEGERLAIDCAAQCLGAMAADPAAGDEALQGRGVIHHGVSGVRGLYVGADLVRDALVPVMTVAGMARSYGGWWLYCLTRGPGCSR